jgi:hypothetical protein
VANQLYVIQGASAFWKRQTPVMRGIVLMCLSTVAFSIMHGLVRFVAEVLPPFQIAFFRNIFGLAFLFPLLMHARFAILRTKRIGLHALRGVINMAAIWAVAMIIIKILSRTESSLTIVAYMGIFLGGFSIAPALWVWQPFGLQTLGWMVLIGFFGSIAQMAISQSLKETDPTAVMPFDFLKLI